MLYLAGLLGAALHNTLQQYLEKAVLLDKNSFLQQHLELSKALEERADSFFQGTLIVCDSSFRESLFACLVSLLNLPFLQGATLDNPADRKTYNKLCLSLLSLTCHRKNNPQQNSLQRLFSLSQPYNWESLLDPSEASQDEQDRVNRFLTYFTPLGIPKVLGFLEALAGTNTWMLS